jgi:hypothetical protein
MLPADFFFRKILDVAASLYRSVKTPRHPKAESAAAC